jgi:hypothetical protein
MVTGGAKLARFVSLPAPRHAHGHAGQGSTAGSLSVFAQQWTEAARPKASRHRKEG